MAAGIIYELRKEIDKYSEDENNGNRIECTREILLKEIKDDKDKLFDIKANLINSGDLNEVAVVISVIALFNSLIGDGMSSMLLNSFFVIVCVILYNFTQKANEGNKYIRVVLEEIENNWEKYFEGNKTEILEDGERVYNVKIKCN